jgi:hypothetical protein
VTKTSDFYSQRQWHSAPMYSEYLRRFGVEDEIVACLPACLPAPPGRSLRLLLRRDSGGFTERDKLLVELLRPHLHAVYQDAQRRRTGAPRLTARQWELLRLVAAGHSNADIARQLFLSETPYANTWRTSTSGSASPAAPRQSPSLSSPDTRPSLPASAER